MALQASLLSFPHPFKNETVKRMTFLPLLFPQNKPPVKEGVKGGGESRKSASCAFLMIFIQIFILYHHQIPWDVHAKKYSFFSHPVHLPDPALWKRLLGPQFNPALFPITDTSPDEISAILKSEKARVVRQGTRASEAASKPPMLPAERFEQFLQSLEQERGTKVCWMCACMKG